MIKKPKKDVWKLTEKKKRKVKRCIYQNKKKVNEQFGRKMNEVVNGNRNAKGVKVESCIRIKYGNRRLPQGEDEVQRIWKEYF